MIAKDLIPGMGANPFAIMKDGWQRGACRAPGDGVTTWQSGRTKAFMMAAAWRAVPSWGVTRWPGDGDWLTFSHLTPFPFPRVSVHDNPMASFMGQAWLLVRLLRDRSVRGSRIIVSMNRRRDRLTLSHLESFSFLRIALHDSERCENSNK